MKHTLLLLLSLLALTAPAQIAQRGTSVKPVGDAVVYQTTFVLDNLHLRSNGRHVYTPVLEGPDGQTALFQSLIVDGRRQHLSYLRNGARNYPDAQEVLLDNADGQIVPYLSSVPYETWMDNATWRLNTDTCGCGNLTGSDAGSNHPLNFHPEKGVCFAFATPPVDGDDPVLRLEGKAYLDYPVNRTELYPEYRNNPRELQKIIATIDTVRSNDKVSITRIGIHGYASPEGSWANNVRLSIGRAATLRDYVMNLYKFDENIFTVENTPEDWDGLDSLLSRSNLDHRDEILDIVRDQSIEPDPRNERIKVRYPEQYKFIHATWYPALRHSDYTVEYKIRPMTDEEAATLLHTQPQLLSLTKLYRIANLYEKGSEQYNEVFDIAARLYPTDPTANINAANVSISRGDLCSAATFLSRAGDTPEAIHSRGILALLQHDYAEAEALLRQAKAAGIPEADCNLSILEQMR